MTNHITQAKSVELAMAAKIQDKDGFLVPAAIWDLCLSAIQWDRDQRKPGELPPLPEPDCFDSEACPKWAHSADQLQAYGQQCAEQMKERAIAVCDKQWTGTQCAAAIEELK